MIFFASMLLIKPVLVSSYMFKSPAKSIILEMAESEEEKSSKETSSKSYDEFFHSIDFEWGRNFELLALDKVSFPSPEGDEHVSEIVPPPPQS
jgi:hypothetical protein